MPKERQQKKRESQVFSPPPSAQAASGDEGEMQLEADAINQDQGSAASSTLQPELSAAPTVAKPSGADDSIGLAAPTGGSGATAGHRSTANNSAHSSDAPSQLQSANVASEEPARTSNLPNLEANPSWAPGSAMSSALNSTATPQIQQQMTPANLAPGHLQATDQPLLVHMPASQYQAFLEFQKMQATQTQVLTPTSVAQKGASKAAPVASSSKVSARPAFIADLRGSNPAAGQMVLISSSSSSRENREDDESRPPPKKAKEKKSSPPGEEGRVTIRSPHKRPPAQGIWRCPNCGSQEAGHDILTCNAPRRHDLSPSLSAAEIEYLVKLDQLRSHNRKLQRQLRLEQEEHEDEDEDEEGSSLGSQDSESEEEEEENEEGQSFIDDEESGSEYVPSRSTSSLSKSNSVPRGKSQAKKKTAAPSATSTAARLDRLEHLLTSFADRLLPQTAPTTSTMATTAAMLSSWKTPEGMVGIPEMKRQDLLKLPEFEALERKYTDYCDKAMQNKRRPQPIAQCFAKFLPDLKLSFNSLLSRSEVVRKKFKFHLKGTDYKVTEQILNDMPTQVFSDLYKELVTSRTFMASELITHLMETPFQRSVEGEKLTLTALVLQASTAFRERLESCPTQTVNRCTPVQFRDAFVKMVLGQDDRHLADFLHCNTWDEAAGAMMDLEGTGQGVTFMKKVQKKNPYAQHGKAEEQTSSPSQSQPRHDGKAKPGEKEWERIYNELSTKIEHNDTEMKGHTHTFKDRAKRLLQLRDTRAREAELLRIERSITGPGPRDSQDTGSSTLRGHQSQQQPSSFRNRNPANDFDHRDYGDGAGRTARQQEGDGTRRGQYGGNVRGGQHDSFHSRGSHEDGYQTRRFSREPSPRGGTASDSLRESGRDRRETEPTHHKDSGGNDNLPPSRSQMQPTTSNVRRCYNCGGEDHLASECPKIGGDGGARRRAASSRSPSGRT